MTGRTGSDLKNKFDEINFVSKIENRVEYIYRFDSESFIKFCAKNLKDIEHYFVPYRKSNI